MQVSVIIPHLNQALSLEACLSSLDAQTLERSEFEVIVVDNGSALSPKTVVEQHPGTKLLFELNPGPGSARNRGVHSAAGDILAFLDADCRADPNWLHTAVQKYGQLPKRCILGGDVQIWRENRARFTALEAYESVFAYRFKLYIEEHGFSGTGNLAVPRSDFELIGPFAGIQVAEDMEWGVRARAAGYTFLYVPEMIVFHPARETLKDLLIKWDRHIYHSLAAVRARRMWRPLWTARAIAVLMSPLFDWITIASSGRVCGLSSRFKAFCILVVVRAYRFWRMLRLMHPDEGILWNRTDKLGRIDQKEKPSKAPSNVDLRST